MKADDTHTVDVCGTCLTMESPLLASWEASAKRAHTSLNARAEVKEAI
jgi:hypothetical protein